MINYKSGHFVKLKDDFLKSNRNKIDRYECPNVFVIDKIEGENLYLEHLKIPISINDIESIPINGEDDKWVYADLVTLPNVCLPSDSNPKRPIEKIDYSYYLSKKRKINDKLIDKKIIEDNNIKYVHELQDYLHKELKESLLKINYLKAK